MFGWPRAKPSSGTPPGGQALVSVTDEHRERREKNLDLQELFALQDHEFFTRAEEIVIDRATTSQAVKEKCAEDILLVWNQSHERVNGDSQLLRDFTARVQASVKNITGRNLDEWLRLGTETIGRMERYSRVIKERWGCEPMLILPSDKYSDARPLSRDMLKGLADLSKIVTITEGRQILLSQIAKRMQPSRELRGRSYQKWLILRDVNEAISAAQAMRIIGTTGSKRKRKKTPHESLSDPESEPPEKPGKKRATTKRPASDATVGSQTVPAKEVKIAAPTQGDEASLNEEGDPSSVDVTSSTGQPQTSRDHWNESATVPGATVDDSGEEHEGDTSSVDTTSKTLTGQPSTSPSDRHGSVTAPDTIVHDSSQEYERNPSSIRAQHAQQLKADLSFQSSLGSFQIFDQSLPSRSSVTGNHLIFGSQSPPSRSDTPIPSRYAPGPKVPMDLGTQGDIISKGDEQPDLILGWDGQDNVGLGGSEQHDMTSDSSEPRADTGRLSFVRYKASKSSVQRTLDGGRTSGPLHVDGKQEGETPGQPSLDKKQGLESSGSKQAGQGPSSPLGPSIAELAILEPGGWLSSDIISKVLRTCAPSHCLVLDPLFYDPSYERGAQRRIKQLHRGITMIVIPLIHRTKHHWTLVLVYCSDRSVHHYDSYRSLGTAIGFAHLRKCIGLLSEDYPDMKFLEEPCPQQDNIFNCSLEVIANACNQMTQTRTPLDHRCKIWRLLCRLIISEDMTNPINAVVNAIDYLAPFQTEVSVSTNDKERHKILRGTLAKINSERARLLRNRSGAIHIHLVLTKLLHSHILTAVGLSVEIKSLGKSKTVILRKIDNEVQVTRFSLPDFRHQILQSCATKEQQLRRRLESSQRTMMKLSGARTRLEAFQKSDHDCLMNLDRQRRSLQGIVRSWEKNILEMLSLFGSNE